MPNPYSRLSAIQAHFMSPIISSSLSPEPVYQFNPDQASVKAKIASSSNLRLGSTAKFILPEAFFSETSISRLPNVAPDPTLSNNLPSPLSAHSWAATLKQLDQSRLLGTTHELWADWQMQFCPDGLSGNLVTPTLVFDLDTKAFSRNFMVLLSDPEDCERIARTHLAKSSVYKTFGFMDSLIGTDDIEYWKTQRQHIVPAFLPHSSLREIFPVTATRAAACADRLWEVSQGGREAVDMSNFFLHETQAQLQLALMGLPEKFMENTNEPLRAGFAGRHPDPYYIRDFLVRLAEEMRSPDFHATGGGCPVRGPLSQVLTTLNDDYATLFSNCFIFSFAGHDTTGHTLAFLLYELCRHPELQRRLQVEVDSLSEKLGSRELCYDDLPSLPFLTKCVMETLRVWPAVPNGTFRKLSHDDLVKGPSGAVELKAGTLVTINTWARHRNPKLWGQDVLTFNPDREFLPEEIWHNQGFGFTNPNSHRFSPFTHGPRDCVGKNFAQMEIRAIVYNLFKRYSFSLEPSPRQNDFGGVNRGGTMGPLDVWSEDELLPNSKVLDRKVALRCRITPRKNIQA